MKEKSTDFANFQWVDLENPKLTELKANHQTLWAKSSPFGGFAGSRSPTQT